MRQNAFFVVIIIAFSMCRQRENSQPTLGLCDSVPFAIDSMKVGDLYDSARWYIYTWQCEAPYRPKDDTTVVKTFGELQLFFDSLVVKNGILEFNFSFADSGKKVIGTSIRDFRELITGVGFDIKTHSKQYMISPNGFTIKTVGGNGRYVKPLQPEVVDYIQNNWSQLDSCFKKLAIQNRITNISSKK